MGNHHQELVARLQAPCGETHVSRSTRDLKAAGFPPGSERFAVVVRPGAAAEIAEIVRLAAESRAVIAPVGTASRPRYGAGDIADLRPAIVLDMKRMNHVLHLDETSLTVQAQAGLTGLKLEELLLPRGLSLGDFTPAALRSTLGGLLSVRTPGKASPRHGFIEDAVVGLSAVLPSGQTIHTRMAPRRATGPDLARLFLGSEGSLGIITSVVLRIHRRAETRLLDAFRFPSVASAVSAAAWALREDARPAALRIFDAAEACAHLGGEIARGAEAVLVVATTGAPELARLDRHLFTQAARRVEAEELGPEPAEVWWRRRTGHRVQGPTPPPPVVEITAPYSRLAAIYRATCDAARDAQREARGYITRFDAGMACLFMTILLKGAIEPTGPGRAAVERAARAAGGYLVGEREETLAPYLTALRKELDPHGVFNPFVL